MSMKQKRDDDRMLFEIVITSKQTLNITIASVRNDLILINVDKLNMSMYLRLDLIFPMLFACMKQVCSSNIIDNVLSTRMDFEHAMTNTYQLIPFVEHVHIPKV